jgi:choline dehydrogenase-like flavoprotein
VVIHLEYVRKVNPLTSIQDSYDFIVVGAGTAGCVIAARLSEDESARVLLLEAGSEHPPPAVAVPPAWPSLQTSADWADTTVPQAATGRTVHWPRGRGLGGSSAINAMNFLRGHRGSYDAWVTAGAKGRGFEDLLSYFRRSDRAEGRDPAVRGIAQPASTAVLAGELGSPPPPVKRRMRVLGGIVNRGASANGTVASTSPVTGFT